MGEPIPHTFYFQRPIAPWHLWFAWHPVRSWDGRWTWLRTVWRQRVQTKENCVGLGAPLTEGWDYCFGAQQ